ncbi:MAG TPA: BACON domain-containing carbohydrate-binding protein [Niastella sp.]
MTTHITQFRLTALILLMLPLLVISCYKIDAEGFAVPSPDFSFTAAEMNIANTADTIEISVNANLPWRVATNASWITLLESKGMTSGKIRAVVTQNKDVAARTAEIFGYITADAKVKLTIIQAKGDPLPTTYKVFYVKTTGADTKDGLSWANATTLDAALTKAASGDTIHVAEGTYVPATTITGGDAAIAGDKTFEIDENVTIIGGYPANAATGAIANAALYTTTLSGNDISYHTVVITAQPIGGRQVSLKGLTITKGHAAGSGTVTVNGVGVIRNYGGGMVIGNAKVEMDSCKVIDNKSDLHIPGIYILNLADVTLKHTSISLNTALTNASSNAAGIWNNGCTLRMYDSEITGNQVTGVGGGIYSLNTSIVSYNFLYNVTIADNKVGSATTTNRVGAGIYSREKSQFTIVNCTFYNNTNTSSGSSGFGAGLTAYGGSTINIINCTFTKNTGGTGNTATNGGSAIFNNNSPTANTINIYNSVIAGNQGYSSEVGGANISIKSSVTGSAVYNYSGAIEAGQSFDAATMFGTYANHGGFGYNIPVVAGSHAASTLGMTDLQLQALAGNLLLDNNYYLKDQNHRSRTGSTTMGAALP